MILRQTERFFVFFKGADVLKDMFHPILGYVDLEYSKIYVYLQSLQNREDYEEYTHFHMELLCRWLQEHDMG